MPAKVDGPHWNARLSVITLAVKDQNAALEYYTKKVGFEVKTDLSPPGSPRWVTVGPKGQDIELSLFQVGSVPESYAPHAVRTPGNGAFTLNVEDCAKAYEELGARGIAFKQKPAEQPWGTYTVFNDPDGNQFTILQARKGPASA